MSEGRFSMRSPGGGQDRMAWQVRPDNPRWIALGAFLSALVVLMPAFLSPLHVVLTVGAIVAVGVVMFCPRRAVMAMVVTATALPVHLTDTVKIPLGFRPWEILLLLAAGFVVIDILYRRQWKIVRTRIDGHVLVFLGLTLLSAIVGAMHGNATDVILRNVRYPLYFIAFFLATQSVDARTATTRFPLLLIVVGACVSAEYMLEFLGTIDLAAGNRFVRVARRQGIVLPLSLLMIANHLIHDRQRWRGWLPPVFVFTGIGFALTLGRGMWVSFGIGLLVSIWLWQSGQPAQTRRWWKGGALAIGLVGSLAVTILAFQRVTGTSISAHALERSRTFVDYTRDVQVLSRLLNYATALQEIAKHPVLGVGQGTELTAYSFNPETDRYETWKAWTLDSLYLTLWLKMGLVGLLLFVWLCVRVGRRCLVVFHGTRAPPVRAFVAAVLSTLVAMLVLGISDGSMINGRFAAVIATLMGLVMILPVEDRVGDGSAHADPVRLDTQS